MEFIALFTPVAENQPSSWPALKDTVFWEKCAVSCTSGKPKRSGEKKKLTYGLGSEVIPTCILFKLVLAELRLWERHP